jgi:hypothetical protein
MNTAGAKNPYALSENLQGPKKQHPSKTWTIEEQNEKLVGYIEVPPQFWDHIKFRVHIRYYTKDEGFRTGGFVLQNPFIFKSQDDGTEKKYIKLQNGFNEKAGNYMHWMVDYENLDKIFMKPDAGVMVVLHSLEIVVKGINDNIRRLAEHSKRLEARLSALEK